jgi:catechol 2,3-dioxygenase-like lactoylglutathione lyase family enzyme
MRKVSATLNIMLDHITLHVRDVAIAKNFYANALKPLNYEIISDFGDFFGMGVDGKPDLWIDASEQIVPTHVAFRCSRSQVDSFYQASLAAGGKDNGPPGIREIYHPNYYGAFVTDPDGNNIEAVCHDKG